MSANTNKALNILITGGARGIGRGLFRQFLAKGHRVFILDNNTEELEHVKTRAEKWASAQGSWHALQCDLSKRGQIKDAVQTVKETFDGKLDVLINNAFPTTLQLAEDRKMEAKGDDIEAEWDL